MALANTACILAADGAKVTILDFDLEAPGIDSLPPFCPKKFPPKGGIVEYIAAYDKKDIPDPENLPSITPYSYPVKGTENITVVPAGKKDAFYQGCLTELNWSDLYKRKKGFDFFKQLKNKIENELKPDYLLIDSRTGLADIAGITTHQLADMTALVFNLNRQNLDGIQKAYQSILNSERPIPAKILLVASPVPVDQLTDYKKMNERLQESSNKMEGAVNNGTKGKDKIILITYHPYLALDDIVFVSKYPDHEISRQYEEIADQVQKNNPNEVRSLLERAFLYAKEDRLEEAKEEFKQVINKKPGDAQGHYHYGRFLLQKGEAGEAMLQFLGACQYAPKNPDYFAAKGMALTRLKRDDQALEAFEKAESLAPDNQSVLEKIANIHFKLKNSEKYMEYMKKLNRLSLPAIKSDRVNPVKKFDELYPSFIEAKLPYPDEFERDEFWRDLKGFINYNFIEKIGLIISILEKKISYIQIKQLTEMLKKEKEKFAEVPGMKFGLLQEKLRLGELESIRNEKQLLNLARTEPKENRFVFYSALSFTQTRKKEYKKAIESMETAIKIAPKDTNFSVFYFSVAYNYSALAKQQKGKVAESSFKKAFDNFRKSLEINSNYHEAFYYWGIALGKLAEFKQGKDKEKLLNEECLKYQKATEIKPDKHDAFYNWGVALGKLAELKLGKNIEKLLNNACLKYKKATKIKPDKYEAFNNWGSTLGRFAKLKKGKDKEKRLNEACLKFKKATKIKPEKHEAFNNWGAALISLSYNFQEVKKEKLLKEALEKARKAESIKKDGAIYYNIACIYALQKNKGKALSSLKEAIKGNSSFKKLAANEKDFDFIRSEKDFKKLTS